MSVDTGSRRWWALGALVLSLLTIGLDATVLNVALPTIATELSAGTGGLQWVVNSYTLVFAGLLLPFGALGDRFGRKRLLIIGLAVFGAASLLAAWTDSLALVIGARTLMGVGAAMITPIALAVIPVLFHGKERGKAIALVTMGMGIGIPLGPIVGGYLLDHYWWGSIFLINVPVVLLGILAIALLLPESWDATPRGADIVGGALSTVGLITLVYGVIEQPARGWGDPLVFGPLALGAVLLTAFVTWELRIREPMIDLRLFRRRNFRWGTVAATLATFALFGLLFVVPQFLSFVQGYDAFATGVRLLPMIGGLIVAAALVEKLVGRLGYRTPVAVGMVLIAGGLALGARTGIESGYGFVAAWLTVVGLGIGLALAPAMDAVLGALPPERAGSGTAITMTLRQTAGALGVALLGSILSATYVSQLDVTGLPAEAARTAQDSIAGAYGVANQLGMPELAADAQQAFASGMAWVLIVCAGIALLGAVLSALYLPGAAASPTSTEESDHDVLARAA